MLRLVQNAPTPNKKSNPDEFSCFLTTTAVWVPVTTVLVTTVLLCYLCYCAAVVYAYVVRENYDTK